MENHEKYAEILAKLSDDHRAAIAALTEAGAPAGMISSIADAWDAIERVL